MKKEIKFLFEKMITFIAPGAFLLVLLFASDPALSQTTLNNESIVVENVSYIVAGGKVFIKYDLIGSNEQSYKVSLALKRSSNSNIIYIPKTVSGDIGEIDSAGKNKEITWEIKNDFPQGLSGEDYYFVVQAEKIDESSNLLTWVGIGAAAIVTVVSYLIIGQNDSGNTGSSFPPPPNRP